VSHTLHDISLKRTHFVLLLAIFIYFSLLYVTFKVHNDTSLFFHFKSRVSQNIHSAFCSKFKVQFLLHSHLQYLLLLSFQLHLFDSLCFKLLLIPIFIQFFDSNNLLCLSSSVLDFLQNLLFFML
jgi:hypothetical protein